MNGNIKATNLSLHAIHTICKIFKCGEISKSYSRHVKFDFSHCVIFALITSVILDMRFDSQIDRNFHEIEISWKDYFYLQPFSIRIELFFLTMRDKDLLSARAVEMKEVKRLQWCALDEFWLMVHEKWWKQDTAVAPMTVTQRSFCRCNVEGHVGVVDLTDRSMWAFNNIMIANCYSVLFDVYNMSFIILCKLSQQTEQCCHRHRLTVYWHFSVDFHHVCYCIIMILNDAK